MKSITIPVQFNLITAEDVVNKYRNLANMVEDVVIREILDEVFTHPLYLAWAMFLSLSRVPAVGAVGAACVEICDRLNEDWNDQRKRTVGSIMCVFVEANGGRKSGRRTTVPYLGFTTGEVYTFRPEAYERWHVGASASMRV